MIFLMFGFARRNMTGLLALVMVFNNKLRKDCPGWDQVIALYYA
jgi:hypothetical protein